MLTHSDKNIIDSWHKNARPWTAAVREGSIESRRLVTDKAIVDAVLRHSPGSVLDIGCGEGWLLRALAPSVHRLVGVDVVPELVDRATELGGGTFLLHSYEALADLSQSPPSLAERFDVAVCNFSLIGKESVEGLFRSVASYLNPDAVFIVQTLHPAFVADQPYVDGWREGSWAGFDSGFSDPAPWYFRTLASWISLFEESGLRLLAIEEPIHPRSRQPSSIVFTAGCGM